MVCQQQALVLFSSALATWGGAVEPVLNCIIPGPAAPVRAAAGGQEGDVKPTLRYPAGNQATSKATCSSSKVMASSSNATCSSSKVNGQQQQCNSAAAAK